MPEYWIVDTNDRVLWRHLNPTGQSYDTVDKVQRGDEIRPAAPELSRIALRIDDLG